MSRGMIEGLEKKQEKGYQKKQDAGRRRIGIALLGVFLFSISCVLVCGLAAQEPQRAPISPDFLKYLDDLNSGRFVGVTPSGHGLGHVPPLVDLSQTAGARVFRPMEAYPLTYDLRSYSKVSSVKDQGGCGSCWSFATYGSLESYLLPAQTWNFAEQDLIDHAGFDRGPCAGGNQWMSTAYLARWSGPLNEADDPYQYAIEGAGTAQKHVQNVIFIPTRTGATDNDNIKQAVMTYGACYISFYWADAYYTAANYAYCYPSAVSGNHAVTLVGWDDNFDKTKFTASVPAGNGAFLIKNSWGTSWGQSGYFWISYYDASFQPGAVTTGESLDNYSGVYQYDPLGWVDSYGYGSGTPTVAYCANVFTATSSNPIKAVGTYATSTNCAYTVSIYTGVTAGSPTSGTLAATKSGTLAAPGFYTIALDSPVAVTSGQLFSVVVRYETPGYNWPMPVEEIYSGYSGGCTSSAGQSFWSSNGTAWSDAYDTTYKRNICIKAYTLNSAAIRPVISGTVRTAGGTGLAGVTVTGLSSEQVTPASGVYSDGVTPGWSGTVLPSAATYTFSPSSRSYTSVMANQLNQDFTASTTGCSFTIGTTAASYDVGGGTGSVAVLCGGACAWTAASNNAWIHITSGTPGLGNGTVQYSVDSAAGLPSRTGTMIVAGQTVTITERGDDAFQTPAGYIVLPECIWAPATGGGTWVSEVQITDITGGSMVSAYFSYGAGGRRGPITVWNNGGGSKSSIKFSNLLSFLGTIDTGFTYYGKVGTVEFQTQDGAHRVQVGARTLNGNYSKTFPGLAPSLANVAYLAKPMMIQNFTNNATYRSTCGFFNPTVDSLTVQFQLCNSAGATIGATFSKSFAGFDFQAFSPFTEAGVPYPANSYDNAYLKVTPTAGSGKLVCFGASANNTSNDPAAHLAVQYQGTDDNSPSNLIVLPECIWAPASGGGTWVSEVQITDLSGGSAVSASFYPGGGAARLSIPMWTNAGGAGCSQKFTNFLSSMGTIDSSFTYYGKVGTVEFTTQDAAHKIQVAARTLNGNYAKTFPGLRLAATNIADATHKMIIQNYTNNATYRSTCGFFNPTANSVTVQFTLYDGNGAMIGSAFSKTFVGYDFQAFSPFTEAGVPYPANSYDDVTMVVTPTAGTGNLICFGASANNASNDPAAHIALQNQ